MQTDDIKDAG